MELRPPLSSSDEGSYPLAGQAITGGPLSLSPEQPIKKNIGGHVGSALTAMGVSTRTVVADPVTVGLEEVPSTSPDLPVGEPQVDQASLATPEAARDSAAVPDTGLPPVQAEVPEPGKTGRGKPGSIRVSKLRPRRRRRVRMRYLMQAWSVSLLVHVVILLALAAATFTAKDAVKKILNFDSALAGFRDGEQEVLPIYADPDNIRRDRAVGDENANKPGEPALVVMSEGEGDEGEAQSPWVRQEAVHHRGRRGFVVLGKAASTKEQAFPASRLTGWVGRP